MSLNWLSCVSGQSRRSDPTTPPAWGQPTRQQQGRQACRCVINSKAASPTSSFQQQQQHQPPPIPVPQGSALRSRHREVKEDSGCYVTETRCRSTNAEPPSPSAAVNARWSLQEDSGVYSSDLSGPSSNHPQQLHPPNYQQQDQHQHQHYQRPSQDFNSFCSSSAPIDFSASLHLMKQHSSCVPKLPNRQAPQNDSRELRQMLKARERELLMTERRGK